MLINWKNIRHSVTQWKEALNANLARPDAQWQPALLGLVVGIVSGSVIIAFRFLTETGQAGFLPGGHPENYEPLNWPLILLLPILSGLLIGLFFTFFWPEKKVVGVIHVMERLAYFQGHLGWPGLIKQFVGATLAIIGGHSVGREGPSIHLGAASGSLLAQYLKLPNNTRRTLIACGCSAGIAASFNTPLAGVIFAMEVVMMEYSVASFIPVILAAVSATSLSIFIFGNESVFSIPPLGLNSLHELPFVIMLGLLTGLISTLFIKGMDITAARSREWPFVLRATLAGFIVALCGLWFPQVMGIGYDSVNSAMLSELGLNILAGVLLIKLIATTAAVGLGIPGGLIGPTLFIGAMLGGSVGYISLLSFPEYVSDAGVYALLGMGAMMAATLQAPLAALIAILELTGNPSIIFPGMLAIVIAELTRSELFHQPSIFRALLQARGLDYQANPMSQLLHRIGIASVMSKKYVSLPFSITQQEAREALKQEPQWLLLENDGAPEAAMPAVDLARYLKEQEQEVAEDIDLNKIPAQRREISGIHLLSTVKEADDEMRKTGTELLFVYDTPAPTFKRIKGIVQKEAIESAYRF
jgi:H+/Cl- antiporter ClcA